MSFVKISDITEDTFLELKYKWLTKVPVSVAKQLVRNGKELVQWRDEFLDYYGPGSLHLVFNSSGQIFDCPKFKQDLTDTHNSVDRYYRRGIYTGD